MIARRNTPSKQAILNVLNSSKSALSQEDIEKMVAIEMDRATIYRTLSRFCEDGIVHKIISEDGKQFFAICIKCEEKISPERHFHFKCLKCKTIECLQETVKFTLPSGYRIEGVNCLLTGYCAKCV
jgi:Fur family transcriptional regulator, ferric uptake regulator